VEVIAERTACKPVLPAHHGRLSQHSAILGKNLPAHLTAVLTATSTINQPIDSNSRTHQASGPLRPPSAARTLVGLVRTVVAALRGRCPTGFDQRAQRP
jgi:hypothetical protein